MNALARFTFDLDIHPLTKDVWEDFEELFGERGACGGCWCMWWRLTHSEFNRQKGEGNRRAMRTIVESGEIPGLLAYAEGEPIGWISVAPREQFPRLERSRILRRIDDAPVWSVVCFFIHKRYRKQGMSVKLLQAAIDYVKKQGGSVVEGYPVEPKKERIPDLFGYHGMVSTFKKVGFEECLRRSETRPIMRYRIERG